MPNIKIAYLGGNNNVYLADDGLEISGQSKYENGKFSLPYSRFSGLNDFGKALNYVLPILLEQEIIEEHSGNFLVPHSCVSSLYDDDYGLLCWLPEFNPYTMHISMRGSFGDSDSWFEVHYYQGSKEVTPVRKGAFLKLGSTIYSLTKDQYLLLEKVAEFNNADLDLKSKTNALLAFSQIKEISQKSAVEFDKYLNTTNVIAPNKVTLNVSEDDNNRVSLSPHFEGVSDSKFNEKFLGFSESQSNYELDTNESGRIRIVLNEELTEALSIIRKHQRLGGAEKDKVLTKIRELFVGIKNPDCIDLNSFGPRVKGIGPYVFEPKPYVKSFKPGFLEDDYEVLFETNEAGDFKSEIGVQAIDGDQNELKIPFKDKECLFETANKLKEASESGIETIELKDSEGELRKVPISDELMKGVNYLSERAKDNENSIFDKEKPKKPHAKKEKPKKNDPDKKYVLIYENIDELEYSEQQQEEQQLKSLNFQEPASLAETINGNKLILKSFQIEGIAWLQSCFNLSESKRLSEGRKGCLLADDMGLGKTLQVLTFLAWCIEEGYKDVLGKQRPPYEPILVVAPKILLENWQSEFEKFFKHKGDIFQPWIQLYGDTLKAYRKPGISGKEYEHGFSSLEIEKICENRLILTNYDTVKNYQLSFAQIEWSIIIVDEAQEIKEPTTAVTWAMKSLNALFRVAMTGTPVENRLIDLWNIMDFAQPGLLGSQKEFRNKFESDITSMSEEQRAQLSGQLRHQLKYDKPSAYLIRRTKNTHVDGLPQKHEVKRVSYLSAEESIRHKEILASLRGSGRKKGKHLQAIQHLVKLYQHIEILDKSTVLRSSKEYIERSSKIQDMLKLLKDIKQKNEKVLVFAVLRNVQSILKRVIDDTFGLDVNIVNGTTSGRKTKRGESLRFQLINEFQNTVGFDVLILSPDVAGVGLNIVAANHVIHFGRWWNPAKESQATDRAYRIGQEKDVFVYYLISKSNDFRTFDEKLDELLEHKKQIANDFLVPSNSLEISKEEILKSMQSDIEDVPDNVILRELKIPDLKEIDPYQFEAFVAALWRKMKYEDVFLTPNSGDAGADVVAISGKNVDILQCKHTTGNTKVRNSVIEELVSAEMAYKKKFLPAKFSREHFNLVCVTNGKADRGFKADATKQSIKLIDEPELAKLIKKYPVTSDDLYKEEYNRLNSLKDLENS